MLAAVFGLSACMASPEPSPTPTPPTTAPPPPTPSATPSAEPTAGIASLVARPEGLELRAANGEVVDELDYLGDAAAAISTIEQVMGSPAVLEEYRGTSHFPPSTAHRWGALELWEQRYVDRWADFVDEPRTLYQPSFMVSFTGPSAEGVVLTTQQGLSAGDTWAAVEATPGIQLNPSGCSGPYFDFIEREETWPDGTVHVKRFGVDFAADAESTAVAKVRAPMPIHEDGCA